MGVEIGDGEGDMYERRYWDLTEALCVCFRRLNMVGEEYKGS